jgi:hypothetical protein
MSSTFSPWQGCVLLKESWKWPLLSHCWIQFELLGYALCKYSISWHWVINWSLIYCTLKVRVPEKYALDVKPDILNLTTYPPCTNSGQFKGKGGYPMPFAQQGPTYGFPYYPTWFPPPFSSSSSSSSSPSSNNISPKPSYGNWLSKDRWLAAILWS